MTKEKKLSIYAERFEEGQQLLDRGLLKEAENRFMECIEAGYEIAAAYNKLGIIQVKQRNYEQGESFFRKSIQNNPDFSQAYSNLGNIYLEKGDFEKAEECYKKAIQLDAENPVPYNNLAVVYKKKGDIQRFVSTYKKYQQLEKARYEEKARAGITSRFTTTICVVAVVVIGVILFLLMV